ncbi:MAG: alpha-amylase family glycosyl hydrolase [Kiritimatiellae bacterium]|nr:alpha-amylase family glycosyl hydrolase [Kiritimatiellia bacterium]
MNRIVRHLFVAGLGLVMSSAARGETAAWSELVGNYQTWRGVYSIMVPPLNATLSDIEKGIASGSYAFTSESGYYWDLTGGDFYVDTAGEIAATVPDGTWVYLIEELATAKVFVMQDGQTAPMATFAAEPWPAYDPNTYEYTLLNELAKRRVVWWLKVRVVADTEPKADAPSTPLAAEEEEGGGYAMMMGEGDPANCDPCLQDLDGDGVSNRDELLAGTDPNNPTSYFAFAAFALTNDAGLVYTWYGVTNREYVLQTGPTGGYANAYAFSNVTSWLLGNNADLSQIDTTTGTNQDFAASRLLVRERDSNTNGIPDWWELQQYGTLTNIAANADPDGDGLENQEEYYFGYSPTVSDRSTYHSIFHRVTVNDNDPTNSSGDDDTELFDFHGGGRTLSLASNALGNGFGSLNGEGKFSTGIYFNNDMTNLYVGISGVRLEGDNALFVFLDTDSGGVTNLRHLSQTTPPYGLSQFRNLNFDATNFTPNVGLILGGRYADGHNYDNYSFNNNNFGQGVYRLSDGADFPGFSDSGPSRISQWARGYSGDFVSAQAGIEIAIALSDLNVIPGSTIKAAALFAGGTNTANERFASGEVYGKKVTGTLTGDNYGTASLTVLGSDVTLTGPENGLHYCSYPVPDPDAVIFQGFYWNAEPKGGWWNTLGSNVADLAQAGFTKIWLPPPYKAANADSSVGYDPFDQYDLGEYDQKGFTRTRYGTKAELAALVSALSATGITAVCDIVLNHMAGGTGTAHKVYNYPHDTFEKSATDFHPSTEGHNDELQPYHDNWSFGTYPPLDIVGLDNAFLAPNMRLGFKKWGNWLVVSNNFQAFRFDFTEAVEPWFVWEWLNYPGQRQRFAFMEYWKNATGKQMQEWLELTGHSAAIYDWNLQTNLEAMCEQSGGFDMNLLKSPSLLGLEPNYTVTFVENHDTLQPSGTNTAVEKRGVARQKELAYAYIMHSQGYPLVFYRDYYMEPYFNITNGQHFGTALKPKIDRLMLIRKKTVAGDVQYLSTNSDVFVQQRDGGGTKPGSILIVNDNESSTLNISVQTMYTTNTVLMDLVATNSPHSVTTDVSGVVTLTCPNRDYRIYGVTNALE